MIGLEPGPEDAYHDAKQHWQWWMNDIDAPHNLDPRDPRDAIETHLGRAYDHHPRQAEFITQLALESIMEGKE